MTLRESYIAAIAIFSIQPAPERRITERLAQSLRRRHGITDQEIEAFLRTAEGMRAKGQFGIALMLKAEAERLEHRLTEPIRKVILS